MNETIDVYRIWNKYLTFDEISTDANGQIRIAKNRDKPRIFSISNVKSLHDNGFKVYVQFDFESFQLEILERAKRMTRGEAKMLLDYVQSDLKISMSPYSLHPLFNN